MAWPVPGVMCLDLGAMQMLLLLLSVPAGAFSTQEPNTLSAVSLLPLPLGASKSIFPVHAIEGMLH